MIKVTRDEVLKIAKISHISIHETEIDSLVSQLETVLSYAARVQEVAGDALVTLPKNINVVRADVIVKTDADRILAQAPETQEHYFVVPAILESNK